MRIALVSQEYPPETAHGGIAQQTAAKAAGLASLGHGVHVLTRSIDGTTTRSVRNGVEVTRLAGTAAWAGLATEPAQWLAWSTDVAIALSELQSRVPLDLVDVPEYGAEGYVHLVNRTPWARVPTVVQLHGPLAMLSATIGWPEPGSLLQTIGMHMEGTCVRLADAVYSSSQCSVEWCASAYGLDPVPVPVLHMGVDTAVFTPDAAPRDPRPTVVFAGRLSASKGVEVLVQAACDVARSVPQLRVELVGRGDPEMVERLTQTARRAGLPDLLRFHGQLDRASLARVLASGTVFAAPSLYEGGPGLVYLEAMACGLPSIACSRSGAAEAVDHGRTGLLVPPDDVAATAAALVRLLGPEGAALGRAGRERALAEHDSAVQVQRLVAFYDDMVRRARAAQELV